MLQCLVLVNCRAAAHVPLSKNHISDECCISHKNTRGHTMVQCEWKHVGRRYWLMLAGDEVYANRTSLVGSIGVINATFGAVEAIKRLGLERRVYTAGKYKDLLDPFRCAHRCHCWPPSCLSVSLDLCCPNALQCRHPSWSILAIALTTCAVKLSPRSPGLAARLACMGCPFPSTHGSNPSLMQACAYATLLETFVAQAGA